MPELPEVETVVQELLLEKIKGKKVLGVEIFWPKTVLPSSPEEFAEQMIDRKILEVKRRGKYIVFSLSEGFTLFVHLRMTGRFSFTPLPHVRLQLQLDDGRFLYYNDPRKFGRWHLVEKTHQIEAKLGLEPLESSFTLKAFNRLLLSKKRQIKPFLLDQTVIAGLGNIYVDEALWYAQIHPQTLSNRLTKEETKALHGAIQHVLQKGLDSKGTTLGKGKSNFYRVDGSKGKHQDILYVFRRTGLACPRCKSPIQRIIVAQRSSHICPVCQVWKGVSK